MYSGTTFRHSSGNVIGAHQRIDRVARRHLMRQLPGEAFFPTSQTILHFEGKNGPDGIKSKNPSVDEPWHFIAPDAGADDPMVKTITNHLFNLHAALVRRDEVRAGFEAAWLAHAIVDGLTPAHHVPLADKIEELWGKPHAERSSIRDKTIIKGSTRRDTLAKNWEYWGSKGVFSAHIGYELGVASSLVGKRFRSIGMTPLDIEAVEARGYIPYFLESLRDIHKTGCFDLYVKKGWTPKVASLTLRHDIPLIIKNVSLAWYAASKGITR